MMVKHLKTEALAKFSLGFSKNLPIDDGLYFHEDLRDLGQKMTQLLHQQRTLYETLCNDTVDMISVYELAKTQIELRDQVYLKMLALFSKNQDNYDLNLIIEVYREAAQFRKDKFFKEINEKAIGAQDLGLKNIIFSTSACVIFVSSSHREGIISKVEGPTQKLFGVDKKYLLGNRIEALMPPVIQKFHFRAVRAHLTHPESSRQINLETFIADSQNNYLVRRIELRLIHYFYREAEFGYFAHVNPIPSDKNYILLDTQGLIQGMTLKIWQTIFSQIEETPGEIPLQDLKLYMPGFSKHLLGETPSEPSQEHTVLFMFRKPGTSLTKSSNTASRSLINTTSVRSAYLHQQQQSQKLSWTAQLRQMFKNFQLKDYRLFEFQLRLVSETRTYDGQTFVFQYLEISRITRIQSQSSKQEHFTRLEQELRDMYQQTIIESEKSFIVKSASSEMMSKSYKSDKRVDLDREQQDHVAILETISDEESITDIKKEGQLDKPKNGTVQAG